MESVCLCPYCKNRFAGHESLRAHVVAEHGSASLPKPDGYITLTVNGQSYEQKVEPGTIDEQPPFLPPTPPRVVREVFEVTAGADADAIQAALDQAAALKGQRPVVHLPKGNYQLKHGLTIPVGGDVQVIGDGGAETATVLTWAGEAPGVVFTLVGPSHATIRDLSIQAQGGTGILVTNCDQPGSRIFSRELNVTGAGPEQKCRAGLLVDGLDHADVSAHCLQGGAFCEKWVQVVGGPLAEKGEAPTGQATVYTGATGTADAQYSVVKGGQLLVRGVYHEMDRAAPQGILLTDRGWLTVDATRFSYKTTAEHPLIAANNFSGSFTLLTGLLLPVDSPNTARLEITGDGSRCNLLCLGNLFWVNEPGVSADKVWNDRSQPPASAGLALCNMNSGLKDAFKGGGGFGQLDSRGKTDEAFVRQMLQQLRDGRVWLPMAAPAGVTNVQLQRVICVARQGGVAVHLRAGP